MAAIERRGNGHRVRIRRYGAPTLTKTFSCKKTAQAWARKTESELERNVYLDTSTAKNFTVSDVLDRYESQVLPHKKGRNREQSRISLLRESIGHIRLDLLRSHHIASFRDHRLRKLKPATVHRDLSVLSNVLTICTKDWGISLPTGNPMRQVRMPKIHGARTRRISDTELSTLLRALRSTGFYPDLPDTSIKAMDFPRSSIDLWLVCYFSTRPPHILKQCHGTQDQGSTLAIFVNFSRSICVSPSQLYATRLPPGLATL